MITIIDSGGANIASIQFALNRLGAVAKLSTDVKVIKQSSHVVLPGVGSAERGMLHLANYSLIEVIQSLTQPVLGICLGMQLLYDFSEEGNVECLKIISGNVKKISNENICIVPHMGWNKLNIVNENRLLKNIPDKAYVYFVHSYIANVGDCTTATACYGNTFSASIQYKNFYGVQFHPERSGEVGSMMLKNFLSL
jgi:glutamine amidotransferase